MGRRSTIALTLGGWLAFALLIWWRLAPNGYNTSDYGFVIGQSWRILHGEVPHLDFISARPAGSALLHTIDFALPLPLVESSRLVSILLSTGVTLFAGVAVLGRAPWRWSWIGHVVVATALLFTINTFQIGPWYTMDGLFFTVGAIAAMRVWEDRRGDDLPVLALLAAGTAPLFKQSFFLAPILVGAWLLYVLYRRRQLTWRRVGVAGLLGAAPGLNYLAVMVITGAISPMISQLTSATTVDWAGVMDTISILAAPTRHAGAAVLVVAFVVGLWFTRSDGPGSSAPNRAIVRSIIAAVGFILSAYVGLAAHLNMYDLVWSTRLFWMAAAATIIAGATQRRLRTAELALVLAAWMTVLSWGLQWPLLAAGAMLLVLAQILSEASGDVLRTIEVPTRVAVPWGAAVVLTFGLTIVVLDDAIQHRVLHRDLPASQLTVDLRSIDDDFGRVRTNPSTAAVLRDASECLADHPAGGVVFGSWNSDLYAVLGVRNPLATDGANTFEITGAEDQYRDSVRALADRGDFLVLFPLLNPETVHGVSADDHPVADLDTPIPEYWFTASAPYSWMAEELGGEAVACGSWVGLWEPARRDQG